MYDTPSDQHTGLCHDQPAICGNAWGDIEAPVEASWYAMLQRVRAMLSGEGE